VAQVELSDDNRDKLKLSVEQMMCLSDPEGNQGWYSVWYCGFCKRVERNNDWQDELVPMKHDDNCEGSRLLKLLEIK